MSILSTLTQTLLPGLTSGVRTALPYIEQLALQGSPLAGSTIEALSLGGIAPKLPILSQNEIIRRIRSAGFSINTQFAHRAIKTIRGQIQAHQYVQGLSSAARPLRSQIPYASYKQRLPYNVRVAVTGIDAVTGELRVQYVTITSTRLISKAQAVSDAALAVLGNEGYQLGEITDVSVISYLRQNPNIV